VHGPHGAALRRRTGSARLNPSPSHVPNGKGLTPALRVTVTPVTGRFDLIIKLRTNEPNKAFNIVEKIRKITSITSTQTGISLQKISNPKKDESEDPIAFALVKVSGAFKHVLQKIKTFPDFVEAHIIPGEFNLFATFHGYSPEELLETSVEKLGGINGITAMETLVAWTPTSPY